MSLIRWYGDNSYIQGIWGAEIEDILIFGGIALDLETGLTISTIMKEVKKLYNQEVDFPVKWNMKDLKSYYEKKGIVDLYQVLLQESKIWRYKIFQEAAKTEFTIIVASIKAHSAKRKVIKKNREKLTRYVFSDAIMRVGLHVKEMKVSSVEIVLDWPEDKQSRYIFDEEYQSALAYGVTCEKQKYHCGALSALGFNDSIFFTSMKNCLLLQFCDLIIGATREFIDIALNKEKDTFGFDCLKELRLKIRGAPRNVIGRGLIIAPTTGEFIDRINQLVPKLYE